MKTQLCLVVEHLSVEHAGTLKPALERCGYTINSVPSAAIDDWRDEFERADLVVLMGGPIGVYDAKDYPFLDIEVELLRGRLAAQRGTLGICLGSQLLAAAAGARVYPGQSGPEVGWGPVQFTEAGREHPLSAFDANTMVLHWHGDTFDLPAGARLLASTPKYANQAFAIGEYALGLQFHVETTEEELEQWFVAFSGEIRGLQQPTLAQLRRDTKAFSADLAKRNQAFVEGWIAQVRENGT